MGNLSVVIISASLTVFSGSGFAWARHFFTLEQENIDDEYFLNEEGEWDNEKTKKFEQEHTAEYRWLFGTTHKKKIRMSDAQKKVRTLKDYSVLLAGRGFTGTGWILDYVLPNKFKGEKYPTRWFIGTAAHVATYINFDVKNPYRQLLPRWSTNAKDLQGIILGKEKPDVSKETFNRKNFKKGATLIGQLSGKNSEYDVEKHKDDADAKSKDKWWFWSKKPKLVYVPYNYLTKEQKNYSHYKYTFHDYSVDFTVFEVDFGDEKIARLFTRNFYNKYNHVDGKKKKQALDFFAEPIAKKYTNKELLDNDIQVFGAGYPGKGIANTASSNYDTQHRSASRFSYYHPDNPIRPDLRNEKGEELLGHVDMWKLSDEGKNKVYTWYWANRKMHPRGYGYVLEDNYMSQGASGSLFATENGEVLGTLSFGFRNSRTVNSFISAIRNAEIRDDKGKILYPAYDLIEGVPDQLISYKTQIQTYVMAQCQQTELSRLRKWENIMAYDKDCSKENSNFLK